MPEANQKLSSCDEIVQSSPMMLRKDPTQVIRLNQRMSLQQRVAFFTGWSSTWAAPLR